MRVLACGCSIGDHLCPAHVRLVRKLFDANVHASIAWHVLWRLHKLRAEGVTVS